MKCAGCGKKFKAERSTRKYCTDTCRKKNYRKEQKTAAVAANVAAAVAAPSRLDDPAAITNATIATLQKAGRLETPHGAIAITLAKRLDTFTLLEQGSSVAALSKELRAVLAEATQNPDAPDDPVEAARAAAEALRNGGR